MTQENNNGAAKFILAIALSLIIGLVGGEFLPNRSVVTKDELNETVAPLIEQQRDTNAKLQDLREQVSELKGELKVGGMIAKTPQ